MAITKTGSGLLAKRIMGKGKHNLGYRAGLEMTSPLSSLGIGALTASGQMSLGGALGAFGAGALGGIATERAIKQIKPIKNRAAAYDARKTLVRNYPKQYGKLNRLKHMPRMLGRGLVGKGLPFIGSLVGWGLAGLAGEKIMDKVAPIYKRKDVPEGVGT